MDPVLGTSFCLSLGDVIHVQFILDGAPLRLLWIASKVYYICYNADFFTFPQVCCDVNSAVAQIVQLIPAVCIQ